MRRRLVIALIAATALTFLIGGTALGYWVIPNPKGESGDCIIARAILERGTLDDSSLDIIRAWIEIYDEDCR